MTNEQGLVRHAFYDFDIPAEMYADLEAQAAENAELQAEVEQARFTIASLEAEVQINAGKLSRAETALATAREDILEEAKAVENQTLAFVARWAWRTDPPNASRQISDTDRLGCIKHHPIIKRYAKPHIDLAAAEAAALKTKEPSHG